MTESPVAANRYSVVGQMLIDGALVDGALVIEAGRIVEARTGNQGALPSPRLDAAIVSPGLVDLQVNGAFGVEIGPDPASFATLAARLPTTGVTTFLPAVISAGALHYAAVAVAWAEAQRNADVVGGARMPGLHLEGPLLAPARAGAHGRAAIAAGETTFATALDPLLAAGAVRLVTLAPERPGALDIIRRLRAAGVTVSLGHSDATFEEAIPAFDAGASLVTHLWSAMSPFHHRAPGLPGAALTDERATVALIADGVHTHPAALALALRAKGAARVALTTDAVAAAGMAPGEYLLGGTPVVSDGSTVRRPDGALAGSLLTMDAAVRNMVRLAGATVEDALAMASTVPARVIGLGDAGRLTVGQRADLTLWSADLAVRATIVGGAVAYQAQ